MTEGEKEMMLRLFDTSNEAASKLAKEVVELRKDFKKYHDDKVQPLHDFKNKLIGAVIMSSCGGGGIAAVLTKILFT